MARTIDTDYILQVMEELIRPERRLGQEACTLLLAEAQRLIERCAENPGQKPDRPEDRLLKLLADARLIPPTTKIIEVVRSIEFRDDKLQLRQ